MTAPAPEFDLDSIHPDDVPADDFGSIPDHTASRTERRSLVDYFTKKRTESDEKPTRGRPRARKPKRPVSRPKQGAFVEPLMQMYGLAGMALMMRDPHCGTAVMENAEACAKAMDELAYQNESVRRVLDTLVTTSAIGQVVMAHAPILVAIASHHGGGKIPFIPSMPTEEENAA